MTNHLSDTGDGLDPGSSFGSGSVIKGIVHFRGDTLVNGILEGGLSCDAKLVIGRESKIRANINSKSVVVFGQVIGDITADNIIEIHPGASVIGDIKAKRIAMHDGVNFDGRCEMESQMGEDQMISSGKINNSKVVHLSEQQVSAKKIGEFK